MKVVFGIPELLSLLALVAGVAYYLLIIYRVLVRVAPANRSMKPELVWLNLIIGFNLFWMAWTVIKLSESLGKELAERKITNPDNGARTAGLVMVGSVICCFGSITIPPLSLLFALAAIIAWSIHWGKTATYLKELSS